MKSRPNSLQSAVLTTALLLSNCDKSNNQPNAAVVTTNISDAVNSAALEVAKIDVQKKCLEEVTLRAKDVEPQFASIWEYEPGLFVVTISSFGDKTDKYFDLASEYILCKKGKGVILDLRNNPGGFLNTSINILSEFVDGKEVGVYLEDVKDNTKKSFVLTNGSSKLVGMPVVVLMNHKSASSSEVLAGALQDFGVAKIVGEKSYGKGTVQEVLPLVSGDTIGMWFTPNHRSVNKIGLEPDVEVHMEGDVMNPPWKFPGNDLQMKAAISVLKGTPIAE